MNIKNGIFVVNALLNNHIILEWKEMRGQSDELIKEIQGLAEVMVPAYTQTELEFAKQMPEAIPTDFMLKALTPLLDQGVDKIDWDLFEKAIQAHLTIFFATMDWKFGANAQDTHFFVVAKDAVTHRILGTIQFFSSPAFQEGSIKAALFGVLPEAQNRGLEILLMGSIFRMLPDIKHIFLHTRSTNHRAIAMYKEWGFVEIAGKLPNWTDLEYRVEQSDVLQNCFNN